MPDFWVWTERTVPVLITAADAPTAAAIVRDDKDIPSRVSIFVTDRRREYKATGLVEQ